MVQIEYKTKNDLAEIIHWELSKKLEVDQTNKLYMHKPESFFENETYKFLLDFEIQRDHQIPARSHELVIIDQKKKKRRRREPGK